MLSSTEIREALRDGSVVVQGFEETSLRPSSYLLRLDRQILEARSGVPTIDTRSSDTSPLFDARVIGEDGFELEPGRLYLASSVERIGLSAHTSGMLALLSSMARAGVSANFSSTLVSATFGISEPSSVTFEIVNVAPWKIRIYPGAKFCHLCLFLHGMDADLVYGGIYGNAHGPLPSNFSKRPSR